MRLMARRAKKSKEQPKPDINVTPLVDVVLVLLIIFMVVTPAMEEGEHIELPQLSKADEKKKDMNPIEVTLAHSGRVLIDKKVTDPALLESELRALHAKDGEARVLLTADARLEYQVVRKTFKTMQDIGFQGVSLKVAEKKGSAQN
jgi:biopolymer transport protein TolR